MQFRANDLKRARIIDWYDDIVEALVPLPGRRWGYYCLIAWDVGKSRLKAFAIIELGRGYFERIDGLLNDMASEKDWKAIRAAIEDIKGDFDGKALIQVVKERSGGELVCLTQVAVETVRPYLGKGVEGAVAPASIRRWLTSHSTSLSRI